MTYNAANPDKLVPLFNASGRRGICPYCGEDRGTKKKVNVHLWACPKNPNTFGSAIHQPEGFNPPPLELRSPEPKKGQLV